jgi:hypothetical protein
MIHSDRAPITPKDRGSKISETRALAERLLDLKGGRPMAKTYTVHARWDEVSRTWWTDGEDIPGLTCQGDTFDELADAVLEIGPELLHANRVEPPGETVVITVVAERQGTA